MNLAEAVERLTSLGLTVSVAESLTGGRLADAFVSVPGTSQVFRGGIVTYATDTKQRILGVDQSLLDRGGPVQAEVAEQMAAGAIRLFGSDLALSTTGVAGPGPADGCEAGTVFVVLCSKDRVWSKQYLFAGDRAAVRGNSVRAAVEMLEEYLADYR